MAKDFSNLYESNDGSFDCNTHPDQIWGFVKKRCNFFNRNFVIRSPLYLKMTVKEYNNCVNQNADAVYRFILKNIRDKEKARDLVQDSFEKLWINVEQISAEKAKSYLFTTAYHKLIDQTRVDKRMTNLDTINMSECSHT